MRSAAPPAPPPRPPLHRLTMLRDDPASAWLSPAARTRIALLTWLTWPAWSVLVVLFWLFIGPVLYHFFRLYDWLLLGSYGIGLLMNFVVFTRTKQILARVKAGLTLSAVRRSAAAEALPVDDWSQIEAEPDGRAVSLVGWVRARSQLPYGIDGKPCVGLALGCRTKIKEYSISSYNSGYSLRAVFNRGRWVYTTVQPYAGLAEEMQDFDLVDEQGRSIPIQVAGARLIARSNSPILGGDVQGQMLISSLDLPLSVEPLGWDTFALRDGDPIMVVGFKTTIVDPSQPGGRQVPVRVAIASSSPRPMLVYPIAAEREPTPSSGAAS